MSDYLSSVSSGKAVRRRSPTMPASVPKEGTVRRVVGADVWFTVDDWDQTLSFGPARWNHASASAPAVDDKCLVVFAGVGIDRPWVVAWAPPP